MVALDEEKVEIDKQSDQPELSMLGTRELADRSACLSRLFLHQALPSIQGSLLATDLSRRRQDKQSDQPELSMLGTRELLEVAAEIAETKGLLCLGPRLLCQ